MGDGVFSRKPGLALTSRPAFKIRIGDVVASPAVGSMPTPTPMKLRSDWRQLCPEQDQTSCEGNVASLGWCADIIYIALLNGRKGFLCASLYDYFASLYDYVHFMQSFNEFMPVWKPVLCSCILCAKYYLMHVCTQYESMMHQT